VPLSQKISKENGNFIKIQANKQQFWCNFTWPSQKCEGKKSKVKKKETKQYMLG
jgi:hypothetical protein